MIHLSHPDRPDPLSKKKKSPPERPRAAPALFRPGSGRSTPPPGGAAPAELVKAPPAGMSDAPFASVAVLNLASLRALSQKLGQDLDPRRLPRQSLARRACPVGGVRPCRQAPAHRRGGAGGDRAHRALPRDRGQLPIPGAAMPTRWPRSRMAGATNPVRRLHHGAPRRARRGRRHGDPAHDRPALPPSRPSPTTSPPRSGASCSPAGRSSFKGRRSRWTACPPPTGPRSVFAGPSNVGKSHG